mmetsp:Transcript_4072/g.9234  ORF Transcript_4072/g.9234 Transcript_4072/m.9234 type:complete len:453 (-) Transcript_4072:297-1655(-)|eukprot:CAMPEP_0172310534 /NCGR_PEP_ID=MMETSP1058-20130122/11537_1 /TAXON_ID=83371 /ORGANISM="Detonula confervacea, Strain CCMP 353" /LENGTH=452 /DNA_ID=CAMNT_0013023353 /DNA_START=401 /DNA_END=1759 /DNA_ORIENTATION=+
MNQDPTKQRWSTNASHGAPSKPIGDSDRSLKNAAQGGTANPSTRSLKQYDKMISTNSDDGDYDLEERGLTASGGAGGNNSNGGDQHEVGGEEIQLDDTKETVLCQLVGANDDEGGDQGGTNDNDLSTFQEVDTEDNNDDAHPHGEHVNHRDEGHRDEGSDASSVDKYADRNSDRNSNPGIDQAEAVYPLPPGSHPDISSGMAAAGGGAMQTTAMGLPLNPLPLNATSGGGGETIVSEGTKTFVGTVNIPMQTTDFKPATGCTNASDFIVRCFVARLRSGITVVKHGRSRWCKSRLRVLHVHPDGRSLSWKPALGEPSSGKRPPKLDLTSCKEVRHAWSPDPDNPMFTGTPILRQKCEAANAHKSFALIFPKRTVDITAVTADQCKVLMEGFSALCFRLQVAQNVATSSGGEGQKQGQGEAVGKQGEDAATLTNTSLMQDSPKKKGGKKRSFR